MLLRMSSGGCELFGGGGHGRSGQDLVDLAGDVPPEAVDDLLLGKTVLGAPLHVFLVVLVPAQATEHDAVEGGVCLPTAAAVEAVAVGAA